MSDIALIVLVLVGLVGSGKSTFAQSLEEHVPNFKRCNQDDLGDRRAVENLAHRTLSHGQHAVIDRTNFDSSQRAHWIRIARQYQASVWVMVFDTPYEVCADRLQTRTGHPTLTTPEQALSILRKFSKDYRNPETIEGYNRLAYFRPQDLPPLPYTRETLIAVLERIRYSEQR